MINDPDLLSELRRHNLLFTLQQKRVIAQAVIDEEPSKQEIEQAKSSFFKNNNINDETTFNQYLHNQGLTQDDFYWQLSLPFRIKAHCNKHFRHKAESHFLTRKSQLDQTVYSLIRTKDVLLANEIYFRIEAGESTFAELAKLYSEGPERDTKGIIGPVPIIQAHPELAELLRTGKSGELQSPIRIGEWWLVVRTESYTAAKFDEAMAQRMSQELFEHWAREETTRIMRCETKLGNELNAK